MHLEGYKYDASILRLTACNQECICLILTMASGHCHAQTHFRLGLCAVSGYSSQTSSGYNSASRLQIEQTRDKTRDVATFSNWPNCF